MGKINTIVNNTIIASPMNYIGGKAKLLPQILPNFPTKINTFYDVFAGGANVAVNINAENIKINDLNYYVIDILKVFYEKDIDILLNQIYRLIGEYDLSKTNEQGFKACRDAYNKKQDPVMLYTLICYSFNYQFRFNNNMQYNNPFGRERSQFSQKLADKLVRFSTKLKEKNIEFSCLNFEDFLAIQDYQTDDFVYLDPPYLITTGSYNDGNRGFKHWTKSQELLLLDFLEKLDKQGVQFALSNVLEHKGKTNDILKSFSQKYRIIELDKHYNNSCYNTQKTGSNEILLVNY